MTKLVELPVWKQLDALVPGDETLIAKPATERAGTKLLAAIDTQRNRHLLIRIGGRDDALIDRRTRGLWVETREYVLSNEQSGRFIDLQCRDSAGHETFDMIACDLAEVPDLSVNAAAGVKSVLMKWRKFWRSSPLSLSREEIVGLFGELWFLRVWLIPAIGPADSAKAWRGPFGSRHDFELPRFSVEAKATAATSLLIHRINGLEQLEPPPDGRLYLFSIRVHAEASATNTVSALVEACRVELRVSDEALGLFESALATLGYSEVSPPEGASERFRVADERLYRVDGGFPRLTSDLVLGGVPSGVAGVSYDIDLAGSDSYVLANKPEDAKQVLSDARP